MQLRAHYITPLIALAICVPCVSAQSTPTPSLETTVEQVLVDVVVTDKDKHVHQLDRTRFHVFEDGYEQTLTFFDEHQPPATPSAPVTQPQLPPNTFRNTPSYPASDTINILLFDALNTPVANQQELRRQMLAYVDKLPPGKTIAVFALTSKLTELQGFTNDLTALKKAIHSAKGSGPSGDLAAEDTTTLMSYDSRSMTPALWMALDQFWSDVASHAVDDRVDRTLDAFKHLAKYLAILPGRKNLIWFSGSFPIAIDPSGDQPDMYRNIRNYSDQVHQVAGLMASARVSIYPVDARGLMTESAFTVTSSSPAQDIYDAGGTGKLAENSTMNSLAEQTGGVAFIHSNDLMLAMNSAIENGDSYYTLGYTPAKKSKKGDYHKLKVVLDGGGYTLEYRRGYYAQPPTAGADALNVAAMPGAPQPTDLDLLVRALPADDPMVKSATFPPGPAGDAAASIKTPLTRYVIDLKVAGNKLTFTEPQPGTHHTEVEFIIVAYDASGNRINFLDRGIKPTYDDARFKAVQADGILARLPFDLPAGTFTLRVVASDKFSGKLGAVEFPIIVPGK